MRLCILISAVSVLTAFGSVGTSGPGRAVQPEPGFNPRDVVQRVRSADPSLQTLDSLSPSLDGGEFLLDTNNTLVPAPGSQTDVALGFDGANFLVVWQDLRGGNYSDICGARVTPAGTVLDPRGLVITQAAYDQRSPSLAFDGTNFLVVWDDYRRGHGFDIYGTRVTPAGSVLDPAGIIITQASNDQQLPAVSFDGSNFLAVWEDCRAGADSGDIYGARITPGGVVLDSGGIAIAQAGLQQYAPVVGFCGGNFLVAWQDCRNEPANADIFGARVTPGGMVLDPEGFGVSRRMYAQGSPTIGSDGTNFFVAFQDVNTGSVPPVIGIFGTRVTPDRQVLDPGGIPIGPGTTGTYPAVGFDGANYLVLWSKGEGFMPAYFSIWGKRVTPDGDVLDSAGIALSPPIAESAKLAPAVGFGGGYFLGIWQDERNALREPDVYGTRVTPEGTVVDTAGLLISQSARGQYAPALGYDGTNFLVVWEDDRHGMTDIYGARVTPSGTVLDPSGIAISQAAYWQNDPVLAFDGTFFLVVWQDYRAGSDEPDIYGTLVGTDGQVLFTDGIAISDAPNRQYVPAVAFGGGNYLVTWQDYRSGSYDLYGTLVDTYGNVLFTDGIAISQSSGWQCRPVLGFDGTNFFAVWEDYRNTPGYPDIYGARIKTDGTVLDPNGIAIAKANQGQYAPVLAFDANNFLVVWHDTRSSDWPDIYGARVSTAGAVFEEGSVLRPAGNQTSLSLARGSGSHLFLAYQGWVGTYGGSVYNTDRIWGQMDPSTGGGVEEIANGEWRLANRATIVRGVLFLPERPSSSPSAGLLDISGRKVLDLRPGANDVRALAPGVYFVREAQAQAVAKVVVTR